MTQDIYEVITQDLSNIVYYEVYANLYLYQTS